MLKGQEWPLWLVEIGSLMMFLPFLFISVN